VDCSSQFHFGNKSKPDEWPGPGFSVEAVFWECVLTSAARDAGEMKKAVTATEALGQRVGWTGDRLIRLTDSRSCSGMGSAKLKVPPKGVH
jgi:hypothetical protein